MSRRTLDAGGLEYVGEGGMISMFGGKLRFPVNDRLQKLGGSHVTKTIRHEMTESGNLVACNILGNIVSVADERPD